MSEAYGIITLLSVIASEMKFIALKGRFIIPWQTSLTLRNSPRNITTVALSARSGLPKRPGSVCGRQPLPRSPEKTRFRLWAPTASKVVLNIFREGLGGDRLDSIDMAQADCGVWTYVMNGDQNGIYYTYSVTVDGKTNEVVDPYAKAVGANGLRGMVLDLKSTDPEGFRETPRPEFGDCRPTDAVVYETHVRDFSNHYSARSNFPGKFLAFTETGKTLKDGTKILVDHLKELGVTHVQLLPSYDYYTVDETKLDVPQFNWGYDPLNYNAPEGSYSTNAYDGAVRINEYKQMVKALHENGIRVIMDVVYNHTMFAEESYLNMTVPHFYHRTREDGTFYNGSACNNETASDRPMCTSWAFTTSSP